MLNKFGEFTESKIGNVRLFTGCEYDKEIGLYDYRARYYSADLGRFISRDPIGIRDNVNLYSYVGNNPVKFVDPMGREKAILSIYADRGDWWYFSGHAWIEITYKWETHSYGLYPFDYIRADRELDNKWPDKHYSNFVSESTIISNVDYTTITNSINLDLRKRDSEDWLNDSLWVNDPYINGWFCTWWAINKWNSVVSDDKIWVFGLLDQTNLLIF